MDFSALKELELVPEDLNSVIEKSLLLIKNQLDRNHVEVIRDLKMNLPQTNLDRNRIEQVFINLFMNAIEAMPEGGKLWVKTYAHINWQKKDDRMIVADDKN